MTPVSEELLDEREAAVSTGEGVDTEEQERGLDIDEALALVEEKRYATLRQMLREAEPADIAELFDELPKQQYAVVFRILPKELAAEVFVELDSDLQQILIESFSDLELRDVLEELFMDDTADLVEEMPANVVKRILQNVTPEARKTVNELLKYPEDSAGSIMTTEFVRLKPDMTVDEAFSLIRKVAIDKETIYTCYVTDKNSHLVGVVTVKDMLCADRTTKIGDIMEEHVISVNTLEDKEEVAATIGKYDALALPVVDAENRLVGIVTVDDAIDVMQDETEEDFAKMNAMLPTEKPYLRTSPFELYRSRIVWLLLLMVSATFTGMIIGSFEESLATLPVLTLFIPMLMDTGGNSGSQASVTVIRALSLGEVEIADVMKIVWKEVRVAVLCGGSLAVVSFGKIFLVDKLLLNRAITIPVAVVVCLTLMMTVIAAKFLGCTLPLLVSKLGFDPAVMASPFITTIVDAVSLLVFFGLATMILHL
ncbi:MAG: magnesium transporter [Lachnospiraceae bacterium]|nr:magnesium transporter [Lachnospiraceae bacterium]